MFSEASDNYGLVISYQLLAKVYMQHNQFELAMQVIDTQIELTSNFGFSELEFDAISVKGNLYTLLNQLEKAKTLLDGLYERVDSVENINQKIDFYKKYSKLYCALGDTEMVDKLKQILDDLK